MLSFDFELNTDGIMKKTVKKKHVKKLQAADNKGKAVRILNCKPEGVR